MTESSISHQPSPAHGLVCYPQGQSHTNVVTRIVASSVDSCNSVVDDFLEGGSELGCQVLLRLRESRSWSLILRVAKGSHSETCAFRTFLGNTGSWLTDSGLGPYSG